MTEPTLIRVTSPRAFMLADLQNFVIRALTTSPIIPDAHAALLELVEYIDKSVMGLFLVREGAEFTGMILMENCESALSPGSTVLHFYNAGSAAGRNLLIQAAIAFARSAGLHKIRGIDISHKPAAFARLFRSAGPATELGCYFEFALPEG